MVRDAVLCSSGGGRWSLSITGLGTVVLFSAGTLLALAFTVLSWDWARVRRSRRAAGILACQMLLLLSVGAIANRQLRWFSSWADLVGTSSTLTRPVNEHAALDRELAALSRHRPTGHGAIVDWVASGPTSRITQRAKVYLPAAYFTASGSVTRFPVVELLAGFPGGPDTWVHPLRIAHVLDNEIAAGRMAATVVVMPVQNVSAWHDSECVNASRGPQLDTYLTTDMQQAVGHDFRTPPPGPGWGLMGYSTGGFCAVNLVIRHAGQFAAAVSMSGYFVPAVDATTGDLYRHSQAARDANSPLWLLKHDLPKRVPYLYLAASTGDPADAFAIRQFAGAAPRTIPLQTAILPTGGHNFRVWQALEPAALDWMSAHLSPPLAPPIVAPSFGVPASPRRTLARR